MIENTGIILTLAYPETIVSVSDEWFSPLLKYVGIGKENYVRAGHAALVLINKETGELEYHDFGRYITSIPNGRVRGKLTDHELDFPIKAILKSGVISNLSEIIKFLATNPTLTHGDGKLIASVCSKINYFLAREHIRMMIKKHFIRYAAFVKDGCNCARFVTGTLIASLTDVVIKRKLINSTRFTPSTIGNVVKADTENFIYEVSSQGEISEFKSSVRKENRRMFLDKLLHFKPIIHGTLLPKPVSHIQENAQWLSGIAAGAWFELHATDKDLLFRFRRISPSGNIDVEGIYEVNGIGFLYKSPYNFVHYSNCHFFYVLQKNQVFRFDFIKKLN